MLSLEAITVSQSMSSEELLLEKRARMSVASWLSISYYFR